MRMAGSRSVINAVLLIFKTVVAGDRWGHAAVNGGCRASVANGMSFARASAKTFNGVGPHTGLPSPGRVLVM